ncbi:hypothetical protein ACRAWG_27830 [Methylobacterium sp. P31]
MGNRADLTTLQRNEQIAEWIRLTERQAADAEKAIHEARQLRDAEAGDPGVIRRTLDDRFERGLEQGGSLSLRGRPGQR